MQSNQDQKEQQPQQENLTNVNGIIKKHLEIPHRYNHRNQHQKIEYENTANLKMIFSIDDIY